MKKKSTKIQYGQDDFVVNAVVIAMCLMVLGAVISLALV